MEATGALFTPPEDPRIGQLIENRYRIIKLGEGGMGAVYEGEHVHIRRRVAIKCLHAHPPALPDVEHRAGIGRRRETDLECRSRPRL